jgi:hypothetical protein
MAPFLVFALALLGADEPPVAAPEPAAPPAAAAPAAPAASPQAAPMGASPVSAPADDYGYVAWCYGAISAYVELYDKAMPEVIRIERAWPTPSTEENINEVYPGQKKESIAELKLFERAMTAAEKASAKPIQTYGAAAIKRGRAVWTGADRVAPAQLAQFWMSWAPPAKCEETARTLEKKAKLMGQALTYNAEPEQSAEAATPAADSDTGQVMSTLTAPPADMTGAPATPAADMPAPDAAPAPEATPADADKPSDSSADAAAGPDLSPEPQVVTDPPASADDKTSTPEVVAPAKGDAASPTGFKPRKKKPELRGLK